jgi:putative chitinase
MSFEFKEEHLAAMIPTNKNVKSWHEAMMAIFPKYGIDNQERIAAFVSQCAHESNNFNSLEENLNYSEDALKRVFGRYFGAGSKRNAKEYARNPEKIANYVYMDVYRSKSGALGNVKDGDGWKFRGRGLKQLTGRSNYNEFGKSIGMTADEAAVYVATEKGAIESACWFWGTRKLNEVADSGDVVKMTKIINGGNIGLDDRKKRYNEAIKILGSKATATVSKPAAVSKPAPVLESTSDAAYKLGSNGEGVKEIQRLLKLFVDGDFGRGTQGAVKTFQRNYGLTDDGVVGPQTLSKMRGKLK